MVWAEETVLKEELWEETERVESADDHLLGGVGRLNCEIGGCG